MKARNDLNAIANTVLDDKVKGRLERLARRRHLTRTQLRLVGYRLITEITYVVCMISLRMKCDQMKKAEKRRHK